MPTPFTHLALAARLLHDPELPGAAQAQIERQAGAFWVGSIVADGHSQAGLKREDTHFYTYARPIRNAPWRILLRRHAGLRQIADEHARVFVGAYLAHLAIDEVWTREMSFPYFGDPKPVWGTRNGRFLMLNLLLIGMDERDRRVMDEGVGRVMQAEQTALGDWLPFLPLNAMRAWNEIVYRQLLPGGTSETLPIIAPRVGHTVEQLRAMLDDEAGLERDLWAHVPRAAWAQVEARMYAYARQVLGDYLTATG